jgi:NAD(P)-dependent dehydrogenase (short-subunit alcohol dehydrogenase family)
MANTLEGKAAVVTGAGRGLGYGIAQELAKEGANIAVLEVDADAAEKAAVELRGLGVQARAYPADVSDSSQVNDAFAAVVKDFGSLDVSVNNAGISRVGPLTVDCTDVDWLDSLAVMQTGVFYCMRAAGRIMISQGSGTVINISSIRGFSPNPGRISYCAPKAAVIMMTHVAAGEWGPHGVRINAIAPGFLRTPMWDIDVARGEIDEAAYIEEVPARRLGLPSEVGRLAVYLASDDSAYVNGSCITIDGGTTSLPAA